MPFGSPALSLSSANAGSPVILFTVRAFINEFSSSEEKGRGVGITHLAWSAGFMSGQLVGGALESVNIALPFIVAAVAVMVSTVFAFVLIRWIPASD